MSLNDAHAFAFSLANTLMSVIVIFRAGDGTLSVAPANEYDGEPSAIVGEIDPFAPGRAKVIAPNVEAAPVSTPAAP